MISFAYANFLCVYVKLYILIVMLAVGITGYGVIEYRRRDGITGVEVQGVSSASLDKDVIENNNAAI